MRSAKRLLVAVPAALSVVPPLLVAGLVAQHARNMLWKDQWSMVGYMAEATHGVPDPAWLTWQVNEHRMPVAFAVQGALAWWTRWDLRAEAWVNVVAAALTGLVLTALIRKTIADRSPLAAAWVLLACSVLVFSLAGGTNWTWGTMNANVIVVLATVWLAWRLLAWTGRWRQTLGLVVTATIATFTFGTGVVLLAAVPAALAVPTRPVPRRTLHVLATAAWAVLVVTLYFRGWHPRYGLPPPVLHTDRPWDYAAYLAGYVGAATGTRRLPEAIAAGVIMAMALVAAATWTWSRVPSARTAMLPWLLVAATAVANGFVTAYGRIEAPGSALFVRYLPAATCFAIGLAGMLGIALIEVLARSPRLGAVLVVVTALGVASVGGTLRIGWIQGTHEMAELAGRLDRGRRCLTDCATASDWCFLLTCWDAKVARAQCPLLAEARIGPFATAPPRDPASAPR